LSLKLSDTKVYEPHIRARLGTHNTPLLQVVVSKDAEQMKAAARSLHFIYNRYIYVYIYIYNICIYIYVCVYVYI